MCETFMGQKSIQEHRVLFVFLVLRARTRKLKGWRETCHEKRAPGCFFDTILFRVGVHVSQLLNHTTT